MGRTAILSRRRSPRFRRDGVCLECVSSWPHWGACVRRRGFRTTSRLSASRGSVGGPNTQPPCPHRIAVAVTRLGTPNSGEMTQSVTNYLNGVGAVCLIAWGVVLWFDTRLSSRLRWPSWALWWCLVLGLAALVPIHLLMDRLLDVDSHSVLEHRYFGWLHGAYIATSSAQWLASFVLLGFTLKLWQLADMGGKT
jgi:hypothetical protein